MDHVEALNPIPEVVIAEWYQVDNTHARNSFNHQGSDVPTLRLLGMVERYCSKNKIKLVKQNRRDLPIALRMLGVSYDKKAHVPDQVSALAHGVFYLVRRNIRKSRLVQ